MSTTTEPEVDLTFRGGVWVRPMFELLPDVGSDAIGTDIARWPEPFHFHDLDTWED